MCRALSIGSYAKCHGTLDTGAYFTQSLYQIDAVKWQGNAIGMHFLEIVGLLRTCLHVHVYTENTSVNIPPAPLKVQLHENTKSNLCWCHCVNLKTHPGSERMEDSYTLSSDISILLKK